MIRQTWMAAAAALLCCQPATAQDARADSAAVIAFVRAYDAAWNAKNVAVVERALSPGYRYFNSTGGVTSRAETLQFLASPEYHVDRAERSELEVRLWPAAAVVSSRWKGSGGYSGGTFNDDQRCSLVLVSDAGAWKLAAEHCTQIQAASP